MSYEVMDKSKVLVKIPLALDAEISDSFGNTEVVNPPTLYIHVDRIAYETDRQAVMSAIYRRVDRIQDVARRKGMSIIDLLKDKGYVR